MGLFLQMLNFFSSINKFSYISQGQDKVFNDKFGILVENRKFNYTFLIN